MAQRYSFEEDLGERQPLGGPTPSPPRHRQQYPPRNPPQEYHPQEYPSQQYPPQQYPPSQPQSYQQDLYSTSPPRVGPGAHPDSAFGRLRAQRRASQDRPVNGAIGSRGAGAYAAAEPAYSVPGPAYPMAGAAAAGPYRQPDLISPALPPQVPSYHNAEERSWGREPSYPPAPQRYATQSNITPGADNFSEAAAGGMAGIAMSVADHNARESGLEAVRGPDYPQQAYQQHGQWANQGQSQGERRAPAAAGDYSQLHAPYGSGNGYGDDRDSHSSLQALNVAPRSPGRATPGQRTPSRSPHHSFANEIYTDDPYQHLSRPQDPHLGVVDPHEIDDDGDDGLAYPRKGKTTSMLSLGSNHRGREGAAIAGGAAVAGGAAGGVLGALSGKVSNGGLNSQYAPVHNSATAYEGHGAPGLGAEKSVWESANESGRKSRKKRLIIILAIVALIVIGVVLGVVFGFVLKNKGGSSAADDNKTDLDINSAEIKALMNNPNLHKVFPGVDYTPLNTQYPDCLGNPPSQNNVTRDVAVLSRLTNTLRLYGTDCNQTQMVIHALNQLKLQDTVKVWMGVWQDNNETTNARQLAQMYDILEQYGDKPFKGVIVANEILFREQMTATALGQLLTTVRSNLTAKGWNLPVATSDLGDKWTAALAQESDYIMSNIHPFFGGINANDAASWTWSFWENHNTGFFKADNEKNVISETGWPSQGGTDCGDATVTTCPDASVAGIDQMNKFMADWVCSALTNGTQYFWFEAFDEPWKVVFNTASQNWEDHWGLMDVNRNLKDGVKIPDCGGKTV